MSELANTDADGPPEENAEVQEFVEQAAEKVQLDIEDALFLVPEPEPEPVDEAQATPEHRAESDEGTKDETLKPISKVFYWGASAFVLILSSFIVWYVYFRPLPENLLVKPLAEVIIVPSKLPEEVDQGLILNLEPFLIEQRSENQVRFLEARFALVFDSKDGHGEAVEKNSILRDAVYYYLLNQDLSFLLNTENINVIKENIEAIINSYLEVSKMSDLLVEKYRVK